MGEARACRCNGTSCGAGTCTDEGASCLFTDNFEAGGGMVSVCTGESGLANSSWARGSPSGNGNPGCHGGTRCWATNLSGNYSNCEFSCLKTYAINLMGVTGSVQVDFWAYHALEYNWDGWTPRGKTATGMLIVAPTAPAWSTNTMQNSICNTSITWPAYGNYGSTSTTSPWRSYQFNFTSDSQPTLFHSAFEWRIYFVSDNSGQALGCYVDDLSIRVTQSP